MSDTPHKGPGRPRIDMTPDQIKQLEQLAAVLNQSQIADFFGFSDRTLRQRITDDPEIAAAYARGRARAIVGVATSLLKQAQTGNIQAATFYLKSQGGWKETTVQELTGADGGPMQIAVTHEVIDPREG